MTRLSLLLGAGLLLATGGLLGSASALVPVTPTQHSDHLKHSDITACEHQGDFERVQLNYDQNKMYDIFVPLNGKLHTIEASTDVPQPMCAYTEQGICNYKTCAPNPVQVQRLGPTRAITCDIQYLTPDGLKSTSLENENDLFKMPGHLSAISCHKDFGGETRSLKHREVANSDTAASNATVQEPHEGYKGCIGGSDIQRIDWYTSSEETLLSRYSLFLPRTGISYVLDPPYAKCAFAQKGGIWSCGPCNLLFYMIDIDTPDTICHLRLGEGPGGSIGRQFDVKVWYGTWKIVDGCHPVAVACFEDTNAAAQLMAMADEAGGDLGPVQQIEKMVGGADNTTFPSLEDFTFIDNVQVRYRNNDRSGH